MIIKLDLDGEEYHGLLGFLKSDANHFTKSVYGGLPGQTAQEPIVKIKKAKAQEGHCSGSIADHSVTLEVEEYLLASPSAYSTPLSVLLALFKSIDKFPDEDPRLESEETSEEKED